MKEKRDRVVSSPSSCPPRSGFAHDPKSFFTITDPARVPSVRSATSPTIFRGDPASAIQRARAMQRRQSSLAILLASEPPSFSLQHKLSRARVPPLYHQAPPPFHLPPLLPARAGNFSKEAFSRQIGAPSPLPYSWLSPLSSHADSQGGIHRVWPERLFVGRGRGSPAFPRRRPGLWQPCAEVERGVVGG